MKVLSASDMRELDAYNINDVGVSSIQLMECASKAFVAQFCKLYEAPCRVVIFCGPGNNGGDGLAVARLLSGRGYEVVAYLFRVQSRLSDDCEANRVRLKQCVGVTLHEITSQFEPPQIEGGYVIIDALFGTGLNRPLAGGFAQLVEFINNRGVSIVSIDMPSGLMDVEEAVEPQMPAVVRASHTLTFHCLKPCMLLADTRQYLGQVHVLDIGLEDLHVFYEDSRALYATTEARPYGKRLLQRDAYGHKGTFGHGLLVAGSYGMAGAAMLSAKAALRGGLGKLTVHTPQHNVAVMQMAVPEAVLRIDSNADVVSDEKIPVADYAAIAFGPGVGKSEQAHKALLSLLVQKPTRLLVDADGLNLLAQHNDWPALLPAGSIITPHRKEWERLLGYTACDAHLLKAARDYAQKFHLVIILKGHVTAVCFPSGQVRFNFTGNSGMATAGSGDVLTGLLLSLLAQGYRTDHAAQLAVWMHGKAGDLAAETLTEEALMASDIVAALPRVFQLLKHK